MAMILSCSLRRLIKSKIRSRSDWWRWLKKSRWHLITLSMSIFTPECRAKGLKPSMYVAVKDRLLGPSKSSLRLQEKVSTTFRLVESRDLTTPNQHGADYKMDVKRSACKLTKLVLDRIVVFQASIRLREVIILEAHLILWAARTSISRWVALWARKQRHQIHLHTFIKSVSFDIHFLKRLYLIRES